MLNSFISKLERMNYGHHAVHDGADFGNAVFFGATNRALPLVPPAKLGQNSPVQSQDNARR